MDQVRLILVGGFLGAGKTTLLAEAARRLVQAGNRVGLITNDQADNLVDTDVLRREGLPVGEVSGGCFCCRFDELVSASQRLIDRSRPNVILGEPVGSCTDLSATVLQPLKKLFADRFRVAPFSVLLDPLRLRQSAERSAGSVFPESVFYIYDKQLEEADLIVVNKADVISSAEMARLKKMLSEQFPGKPVLGISALNGEAVGQWIELVTRDTPAGQSIVQVDYDVYAEGEAALGWLNATVELRAEKETDWKGFCLDLLGRMQRELQAHKAEIAHLKLYLTSSTGSVQANLTDSRGQPVAQTVGPVQTGPGPASLVINARAHIGPEKLRLIVEESLRSAAGDGIEARVATVENFRPARPEPVYRMDTVV
jgi:Ni2+-binding GTPase involved in maturation of urease and hydrogenase